jgi:hypothetical protein
MIQVESWAACFIVLLKTRSLRSLHRSQENRGVKTPLTILGKPFAIVQPPAWHCQLSYWRKELETGTAQQGEPHLPTVAAA